MSVSGELIVQKASLGLELIDEARALDQPLLLPVLLDRPTRLEDRRKSVNPGTWRSMSSSVRAGLACTSV